MSDLLGGPYSAFQMGIDWAYSQLRQVARVLEANDFAVM